MTRKEKRVWLWRSVNSFFPSHEDASISKEQKEKIEQAVEPFLERCLGAGSRTAAPVRLNGEEVAELLWRFNDVSPAPVRSQNGGLRPTI